MDKREPYKVFISSTFIDNKERRKTVEDAVIAAGMQPVGMERFTAGKNPVVKDCQRLAAECDLYVGIIAHRYGWIPKGRAVSITETEYKAAKKAEIERRFFVIDPSLPFTEEAFDQGADKWKKQEKLAAFKKRIDNDQMPAYFTEESLGHKVLKTLLEWKEDKEKKKVKRVTKKAPAKAKAPAADIQNDLQKYYQKVEAMHGKVRFFGFSKQFEIAIDLKDIYIPLSAVMNLQGMAKKQYMSSEDALRCMEGLHEAQKDISLPDAFTIKRLENKRGLVILGDPGSGKTTHLKRLLIKCVREGSESIDLPEGMIPIFLPLRYLSDKAGSLSDFIKELLGAPPFKLHERKFTQRLLRNDKLLFLLDGMDEVADIKQRERVKKWICDALVEFPGSFFVVTSRFAGYAPSVRLGGDFLEMHIRPFVEDQAAEFIRKWYRIIEEETNDDLDLAHEKAQEQSTKLITKLKEPDFRSRRILEMTRNPMLLTNLCIVHWYRKTLPRDRAYLYDECISILLERWQEQKELNLNVTAKQGRMVLQPAAYWMHQKEKRIRATALELKPVLDPALKKAGWGKGDAQEFLRTIRDESGLLTGWDTEHYGFMHLGFQEYLTAREIRNRAFSKPEVIKELASHFGQSWWEEVILLLLSLDDPPLFNAFMKELVQKPAFTANGRLLDMCLEESAEKDPQVFIELLNMPAGKSKEHWKRQYQALRMIDRLDPDLLKKLASHLEKHPHEEIRNWFSAHKIKVAKRRSKDAILTDPGGVELVRIPGGEFMMGAPKGDPNHKWFGQPTHRVKVPSFYIGRYPVTNEEYGRFLKENPKVKEPQEWGNRRFNQSRQPVVGVSWNEANIFAEWTGCRLPSEAEWEYACRAGTIGPRYGKLDSIAWHWENSGDATHPVGEMEGNKFGLYDTLGNVWEWCEDDWHADYKGAPEDGRAWIDKIREGRRVVRGGSWCDDPSFVRASYRGRVVPDDRDYNIGFRISRD
jgi:formylglycine-generating enzyme required for sulfatase activity